MGTVNGEGAPLVGPWPDEANRELLVQLVLALVDLTREQTRATAAYVNGTGDLEAHERGNDRQRAALQAVLDRIYGHTPAW